MNAPGKTAKGPDMRLGSFRLLCSICLALWAAAVRPAYGVVDANSLTNTSPPPDGAPWANVGQVVGPSGVYLGSGWVLTAAHVGAANIYLDGAIYPYDGTSHRLTNSDGTVTDLLLFHLSTWPNLPTLALATASPAPLSQVDMIGYGHNAGSAETNIGAYTGFYWSATGTKSWGNNKVQDGLTNMVIDPSLGNVTLFFTDFTSPDTTGPDAQTSDEGEASAGDSGGGVFQLTASGWRLAGIMDAIAQYDDQPANTAVYGDLTYDIDITTYRSEILGWIGRAALPSLSIQRSATNVLLSWSDTAVGYSLQATTNLAGANWVTLAPGLSATNGQGGLTLPAAGPAQFFRLRGP